MTFSACATDTSRSSGGTKPTNGQAGWAQTPERTTTGVVSGGRTLDAQERVDVHDASVDPVSAAMNLCGTLHLPTGGHVSFTLNHQSPKIDAVRRGRCP
jgi:hypothetical protein